LFLSQNNIFFLTTNQPERLDFQTSRTQPTDRYVGLGLRPIGPFIPCSSTLSVRRKRKNKEMSLFGWLAVSQLAVFFSHIKSAFTTSHLSASSIFLS
jgi:hypothetical protein